MREADIQAKIITVLRLRYRLIAHPTKGQEAPTSGKAHLPWNKGGTKGVADLAATMRGGRALWIEVKKPGGTLSPEQVTFLEHQKAQGALAFVAWSVDDVIAELKKEGI